MKVTTQRIRLDYAPLDIAVSLIVMTPNSPLTQVFDSETGEYEPDRELTPTVIMPKVTAKAKDGSWNDVNANSMLAEMKWFADGKEISTLPAWIGKYEIIQSGNNKGMISISKNLTPGEDVSLYFTAIIADSRLGVRIPIQSQSVSLSTNDKSADEYTLNIGADEIVRYNPFLDFLSLYEYKVSQGLETSSQAKQQEAINNGIPYLLDIPLIVFKGTNQITSGYTVSIERMTKTGSTISYTKLSAGNEEVIYIGADKITLDLRLIEKSDYAVRIYNSGEEVDWKQVSVCRFYPKYNIRLKNSSDIGHQDEYRFNEVMVDFNNRILECPGLMLKIEWYTNTQSKKDVFHNEGDSTKFLLSKTGIGQDYSDSWLETYVDAEFKPVHKYGTDASGNYFTDANGNKYILN